MSKSYEDSENIVPTDVTGSQPLPPASTAEGITRRTLLKRLVVGGGSLAVAGVAAPFVGHELKRGYEHGQNKEAKKQTGKIMPTDAFTDWHKFTVVPSLVQIDPAVKVSGSLFGKANKNIDCPPSGLIVAQQPIAVRDTLLRNVADYTQDYQDYIDRALQFISPGLLAFYEPGPGDFVYLDADAHQGQLAAITETEISSDKLGTADINIDGRQVRGSTYYLYKDEPYLDYPNQYDPSNDDIDNAAPVPENRASVIGQSMIISNAIALNSVGQYDFEGSLIWPIQIPGL